MITFSTYIPLGPRPQWLEVMGTATLPGGKLWRHTVRCEPDGSRAQRVKCTRIARQYLRRLLRDAAFNECLRKHAFERADEIQVRVLQGGPIFEPPEPPR